MKRTKKEIWIKVAGYEPKYLETARNQEAAELIVARYMRQDKYEVTVEGYKNSLPTYEIR